jgi:6-pyruvoyltetrahydropterin/6-carboxytetrahydropterin synthase
MSTFSITREIGIDAGHRVPDHKSKCCNLHGHRYRIQAVCTGPLAESGEQTGMVLDFGFLKEEMMGEIDAYCDHAMILYMDDPVIFQLMGEQEDPMYDPRTADNMLDEIKVEIKKNGWSLMTTAPFGNLYIVPFIPTAENLAKHWYERLCPRVYARSSGLASLKQVKVWETPNCMAYYPVTIY